MASCCCCCLTDPDTSAAAATNAGCLEPNAASTEFEVGITGKLIDSRCPVVQYLRRRMLGMRHESHPPVLHPLSPNTCTADDLLLLVSCGHPDCSHRIHLRLLRLPSGWQRHSSRLVGRLIVLVLLPLLLLLLVRLLSLQQVLNVSDSISNSTVVVGGWMLL